MDHRANLGIGIEGGNAQNALVFPSSGGNDMRTTLAAKMPYLARR